MVGYPRYDCFPQNAGALEMSQAIGSCTSGVMVGMGNAIAVDCIIDAVAPLG